MPISWNEIRQRAIVFSRAWREATRERAEAQTFWNEFFHVFGKERRAVASFEEPVRGLKGTYEFIDLLWPGVLIAEHKTRGQSLAKAESQAFAYIRSLIGERREHEVPRYLILSDFARVALHDLESESEPVEFPLASLDQHIRELAFVAGYQTQVNDPQDPANIKAAELLAGLHDVLEDGGYPAQDLERFMVRLLFCMFAEDSGIFETPNAFQLSIENSTRPDGSDLGGHLARWFEVLNTPTGRRQRNLDEQLAELPFVNGELFANRLPFAEFTTAMRARLLECCRFHWSRISPAVFGSLFQSIMLPRERRQIGAHYTSEPDIMKLVRSLFLDELRERFERVRHTPAELRRFHRSLSDIRLLDPACGCGNFLVVAYRELRRLELDVLKAIYTGDRQRTIDVRSELHVDVDQLYGIEIEEWPARIAEVAIWLMDHQMNLEVSVEFGQPVVRLPLTRSAAIHCGNALRMDWNDLLPATQCSFILGNPPFVGKKEQNTEQKVDMARVWGDLTGAGTLDYVTCWYAKATEYLRNSTARAAFVSTNSITQGEQAGVLWTELFRRGIRIDFGHRTFPWQSEARGRAHVHVVIVGFGHGTRSAQRRIHDYGPRGESLGTIVAPNISPYLTDGSSAAVTMRSRPICDVPPMSYGSMMIDKDRKESDDAGLILSRAHRDAILSESPALQPFIRRLYGGDEFINGDERWCLWLVNAPPTVVRSSPLAMARLDGVRRFRLASNRARTRELARLPGLFGEIRQPDRDYLLVPKVSSERRNYIPIGFVPPSIIASGSALIVPNATPYHFGILHSAMHMAWVRQVCGRMKSDYQYSARLVYNNFPWPESPSPRHIATVTSAVQAVLDVRTAHARSTLADLYDPLTMPADLARAHVTLDRAVDRCYRTQPFLDERKRFEHLFPMWERLTNPLVATRTSRKSPPRRR